MGTATMQRPAPAAEAWGLFWRLFEAQRPKVMAIYRESGLTPPQLMTLRRLEQEHPVPMSEVAKWLACDASNVTGIIDRLEDRGLVRRRDAPKDRRMKMLELTPAGAEVREEIGERMGVPPEPLTSLSLADQRALRDLLRRALGES
jgi:MarR family transcriptional regulator, organic hydroperoxide resistance regulator